MMLLMVACTMWTMSYTTNPCPVIIIDRIAAHTAMSVLMIEQSRELVRYILHHLMDNGTSSKGEAGESQQTSAGLLTL